MLCIRVEPEFFELSIKIISGLVCQQVKEELQKPIETLQPLPIPEWKWEHITIDFVVDLPRTQTSHDAIWVIVTYSPNRHIFWPFVVHFL